MEQQGVYGSRRIRPLGKGEKCVRLEMKRIEETGRERMRREAPLSE